MAYSDEAWHRWVRTQTLKAAEAHQIAMSEATYRSPGVIAYLEEQNAPTEPLTYTSKALPEPVGVRRWTVFPA